MARESKYILKRKEYAGYYHNPMYGGGIKRGKAITVGKYDTLEDATSEYERRKRTGLARWIVYYKGKVVLDNTSMRHYG
jgi:hypothetical protein